MDWITIIWSMAAATSLTLALIHLLIVIKQRTDWWRLLFVFSAVGAAAMAFIELFGMHLQSTTEYGRMIRWAQLPFTVLMLSVMWFVRSYLKAGRLWLAWLATGLRILAAILHFVFTPNLNFREITSLKQVLFLGQTVSIPVGVPNPWTLIGQAGMFLIFIFCLDATFAAWRREGVRRALFTGGSATFFLFLVQGQGTLVVWGFYQAPFGYSLMFLGIVVAMGYELSIDIIRSNQLSHDLHENEKQMAIAVDAAGVGISIRNIPTGEIWASEKWRDLFGFSLSERLGVILILQRVHPDDRDDLSRTMSKAIDGSGTYETQYRIINEDKQIRWIASRGQVEFTGDGKPIALRSASLDVTAQKLAEEAAIELSGRLINAQEQERSRLARELHDDLSQSLALLSIDLEMLGQQWPDEPELVTGRIHELSNRVTGLSSDVHRLSHELHPSKLEQLGLVSAIRGFCREIGSTHELTIEFQERDAPQFLPDDVSLCLYRITQEALQNVVKHSGSCSANVKLLAYENEIELTISDTGSGFNIESQSAKQSLGLTSMKERVRLVNGRFRIDSTEGHGTSVCVRIPTNNAKIFSN